MNGEDMFGKVLTIRDSASVDKVFGKPEVIGEKTIVPIAQVAYGFGAGYGEGTEPGKEEESEARQRTGKGGGGGGGVSVTPKAVLEVTPTQTNLIPIVDTTRVVLAGILLAAWNVFWITNAVRNLKKGRD